MYNLPVMQMGIEEILMQMLHDTVLTDLDPDYAWYDTEISFDNGREVSIRCKPGTGGNHDKLFELDGIGHLSFEDVGELLRNIRNLPPAEKNDAGEYEHEEEQEEREQQKAEQNEKQEEANPYEVGRV